MRLRIVAVILSSAWLTGALSAGALADGTGGAPAPTTAPVAPAKPLAPVHLAPVTAHKATLVYSGPVYERNLAGAVVPYQPPPPLSQVGATTGGSLVTSAPPAPPQLLVPGETARYVDGFAAAPISAPPAVQAIVWAANQLIGLPYVYGGGHASFVAAGYDCSGSVSYALHGASLLLTPEDSSELMAWGSDGVGRWVTIFSNAEHAYMTVAGLRLDTSSADDPNNEQGPRWRPLRPANAGYEVRHPLGL